MTKRELVADDAEEEPQVGPDFSTGGEKLVNVVEFETAEDAAKAQALLKQNRIPAYLAVMVPEAFSRQAIGLLDPGVSDEELNALAEGRERVSKTDPPLLRDGEKNPKGLSLSATRER